MFRNNLLSFFFGKGCSEIILKVYGLMDFETVLCNMHNNFWDTCFEILLVPVDPCLPWPLTKFFSFVDQQISRLIYTNSGNAILALASNAIHLLWKWQRSDRNSSGKVRMEYKFLHNRMFLR